MDANATLYDARRLSQGTAAAAVAVLAGLLIVNSRPMVGIALGLVPIMVALGVRVIQQPKTIGYVLLSVFFMNLDVFLSNSLGSALAFVWLICSGVFYSLVFLTRDVRPPVSMPARAVVFFYVLATVIVALSPYTRDEPLYNWVRRAGYGVNTFVLAYLLLANRERFSVVVRMLTRVGGLLSVINIIEFLNPSLIALSSVPGRSAGLQINPNASAAAILACFVISYLYPQRFALILRLTMFAGIYTTFSRGALLMFWPLVLAQESRMRKLTPRQVILTVAMLIGVIALTIYSAALVQEYANNEVQQAFTRIERLKEGRFDDSSTLQRIRVIGVNFQRFLEHPLVGNGIGSASVIDGPHNQLLLIMAELGIFAALTYIGVMGLLLMRLLQVESKEMRYKLLMVYVHMTTYLLFTHNALYLRFHIMVIAFLCAGAELFLVDEETEPGLASPEAGGAPNVIDTASCRVYPENAPNATPSARGRAPTFRRIPST